MWFWVACLANTYKREMKVIFAVFDNKKAHAVEPNAKLTTEKLNGTLTTFAKVGLLERVNSIRSMGYSVAVTRIRPYPKEISEIGIDTCFLRKIVDGDGI